MVVAMVYLPFLLMLLFLVCFGGSRQRRICLCALAAAFAAAAVFHPACPSLYPDTRDFERTWMEVVFFPFWAGGAWAVLSVAAYLRAR